MYHSNILLEILSPFGGSSLSTRLSAPREGPVRQMLLLHRSRTSLYFRFIVLGLVVWEASSSHATGAQTIHISSKDPEGVWTTPTGCPTIRENGFPVSDVSCEIAASPPITEVHSISPLPFAGKRLLNGCQSSNWRKRRCRPLA